MKKILLLTIGVTVAAALFAYLDKYALIFERPLSWPRTFQHYTLNHEDFSDVSRPVLKPVPDLNQFSVENMVAKIPPLENGIVARDLMKNIAGIDKFEAESQSEYEALQGREEPEGYVISQGVYDLEGLRKAIGDDAVLEKRGSYYILRMPLYVAPGAALIIRGKEDSKQELRLSSTHGGFIASSGKVFIVDAILTGWDEKKDAPAYYVSKKKFRPFLTFWSGSEGYLGRSEFHQLGYASTKSYGISYSTLTSAKKYTDVAPTGWVINSLFEGMYYGFYCYEAEDVAIVNNIYANNIVYGIDPHDRSHRLIIAGNEAYGTKHKHGIIGSREVTDSWIVNNKSHNNAKSGFMLDRTSVRNLVANNLAYDNGSDGITLFESQDNVIVNNKIWNNHKNGIRARNSWNAWIENNVVAFNKGAAVQVYSATISDDEEDRDFALDPFSAKASLYLRHMLMLFNEGGGVKIGRAEQVSLADVAYFGDPTLMLRGDLADMGDEATMGLRRHPHSLVIVRNILDDSDAPGDVEDDEEEEEE